MTLDGIPVGTLRSNLAEMHIEGEDWCKMMGKHQWRTDRDGVVYCRDCFITLDEENKKYYGENKERIEAESGSGDSTKSEGGLSNS